MAMQLDDERLSEFLEIPAPTQEQIDGSPIHQWLAFTNVPLALDERAYSLEELAVQLPPHLATVLDGLLILRGQYPAGISDADYAQFSFRANALLSDCCVLADEGPLLQPFFDKIVNDWCHFARHDLIV